MLLELRASLAPESIAGYVRGLKAHAGLAVGGEDLHPRRAGGREVVVPDVDRDGERRPVAADLLASGPDRRQRGKDVGRQHPVDVQLVRVAGGQSLGDVRSVAANHVRQLVLGDRRTDLTKLEFDVMHCLLRHEGRTVRRTTLLKEAWGYEDPAGSNVLEAAIRSLRRKLESRPGAIETVRGLGYRVNTHTLAQTSEHGDG